MEIIFHAHHAVISPNIRKRAEHAVIKLAERVRRPVDAIVRLEQDGPIRRVEIVLHAPRRRPLVAEGFNRNYGPALQEAVGRMEAQLARLKRTAKVRRKQVIRA